MATGRVRMAPNSHALIERLGRSDLIRFVVFAIAILGQAHVLGASFGDELAFLRQHTQIVLLSDASGRAKIAVAPAMQGRIMTSTAQGNNGMSFGWINRELIASRKFVPHINVFGGEDRFWMGPEGGQFSIFFKKDVPFDLEHWFTPPPLDTEPFELVRSDRQSAEFKHSFTLTNYSGTVFDVAVTRTVRLLGSEDASLTVAPTKGVDLVAFESVNRVRNNGREAWKKETGLLSIWILGMFNPSPSTTIVLPIKAGPAETFGPPVTSDYFGPVPADRLAVKENAVFFSGDGKFRSKLGINPFRCKPILGSYDAANGVLTLVEFILPEGETNYVNSKWEIQAHPYAGDAANAYNDGPATPGAKPLGPFYELESSSPAAALAPGESIEHVQRTLHLTGPETELDRVALAKLGVGLGEITRAFPPR